MSQHTGNECKTAHIHIIMIMIMDKYYRAQFYLLLFLLTKKKYIKITGLAYDIHTHVHIHILNGHMNGLPRFVT